MAFKSFYPMNSTFLEISAEKEIENDSESDDEEVKDDEHHEVKKKKKKYRRKHKKAIYKSIHNPILSQAFEFIYSSNNWPIETKKMKRERIHRVYFP